MNLLATCIVVVVIAFLFIFRTPIGSAIGRATRIGISRFGVDLGQASAETPLSSTRTADELIQGIDSRLIREIENDFRQRLEGMPDSEKIKALSRLFAASLWGCMAMNTYQLIFGGQIASLEFLNSNGQSPRESLRPFYNAAASQHPNFYQTYSYDQWIGFLESQVLIRNDAGLISITVRGQEFLQHLVRDNLPKVKPG